QKNDGNELGWRSALPDNLKNHDDVKDFTKPGDAIQAFVDLKKEAGSMLKVPGDDATDDERSTFLNKLGRPENPDAYTLNKPEGLPEGVYSEDTEKVFRTIFHEAGLNDDAAQKLWGKYHEMATEGQKVQVQKEKEANDKAINDLKDVWTGDKFDQNVETAHRAFSGLFENAEDQEAAKAFLAETKVGNLEIGNHPMFLKLFHRVGSIVGDDSMNFGRDGGDGSGMSDEDAAKKRFPNTKFD
ncbi:MAG: hypothetical protein PF495_13575, partial [Spirochaetales bacterium]|nr:hypothetical protein [Spirochaetales bacterium]